MQMYDPLELVKRSSDAALLIDGKLRVLAWNSDAEALLGISNRETTKQMCYSLLEGETESGESICGPRCAATGCFLADSPFSHGRMLVKGWDGKRMPVQISTIVLPGPLMGGAPKAVILMRPIEPRGDAAASPSRILLKIHTLGQLRMYQCDQPVSWQHWPRQQAVSLLKVMLSRRGRPIHRDALMEALWPGIPPQEGFKRLKVVVHALRRGLGPHIQGSGTDNFVLTEGECYCLPSGPHLWVDADELQRLVIAGKEEMRKGAAHKALDCYRQARDLYQGDYLESDPYSDWVAPERERLREMHLSTLENMASLLKRKGHWDEAVEACQAAVIIDPCRESVQRLLMQCLWGGGQRSGALRQFGQYRQVLYKEVGVEPMEETMALYRQLMNNAGAAMPAE